MITLYNDRKEMLMNKTVKIILTIVRYALTLLLGAGAGAGTAYSLMS